MRETRLIKALILLLTVVFFGYWISTKLAKLEKRLDSPLTEEPVDHAQDQRMEEAMAAMQNYLKNEGGDLLERLSRNLESSEGTRKQLTV